MKSMIIKINSINDVSSFVMHASKVDGDIDVKKGRYTVDGKSLMGMFSLDLSTGATVEYPEHAADFEAFISNFKAD